MKNMFLSFRDIVQMSVFRLVLYLAWLILPKVNWNDWIY